MDYLWSGPDTIWFDIHDLIQIPNGNYLAMFHVSNLGPIPANNYMTENFQNLGYNADGLTDEFICSSKAKNS